MGWPRNGDTQAAHNIVKTLLNLDFQNRFTRDLPADPETTTRPREVTGALYSRVTPTAVAAPKLVAGSRECATLIGLEPSELEGEDFARVFGGNALVPGMDPFAMAYGGHQFGHWAGQLGDGRAINLGELRGPDGAGWTLQLKGAGMTPYSRRADGLAVLRSSVREFLCSEAMFHLGVPTTRALSLVTTGDQVLRDMFYDGNAKLEPGAVVCRVARSFVRFGSFELPASRGDEALLRSLADHVIRTSFPELNAPPAGTPIPAETYVAWIREVVRTTAVMVAHWMRVGFVHGVMNTDNMSILGETIDYGPYGWLEGYDPDWTPNTTDAQGKRYRFGNQHQIAHWNLTRLASAVVPLVGDVEALQEAVDGFQAIYTEAWTGMLASKLGLPEFDEERDGPLAVELFRILELQETDMTIFFRELAGPLGEDTVTALARASYGDGFDGGTAAALEAWLGSYRGRLEALGVQEGPRRARMDGANPRYVLRNYLAQLAIDRAAKGDPAGVTELLEVLRRPYEDQPGRDEFAARRPEWARHRAGCSMLSCSS